MKLTASPGQRSVEVIGARAFCCVSAFDYAASFASGESARTVLNCMPNCTALTMG